MRETTSGCLARRDGPWERQAAVAHGAERCPGDPPGSLPSPAIQGAGLDDGGYSALLSWEAAGTKRCINPSLLIKVMVTCARAQALSRGRINRRAVVLAHQNPTPATASAQMAPLICAS